jgi:hypothetical protein
MPVANDAAVEEAAIDSFLDASLSEDEQRYLAGLVNQDNVLASLFEKLLIRAVEVSHEGEIEGPGTGESDSIPARLSDGEFVFSADAVRVIGVDKLERLMHEAESKAGTSNADLSRIVEQEVEEDGTGRKFKLRRSGQEVLKDMDSRIASVKGMRRFVQ